MEIDENFWNLKAGTVVYKEIVQAYSPEITAAISSSSLRITNPANTAVGVNITYDDGVNYTLGLPDKATEPGVLYTDNTNKLRWVKPNEIDTAQVVANNSATATDGVASTTTDTGYLIKYKDNNAVKYGGLIRRGTNGNFYVVEGESNPAALAFNDFGNLHVDTIYANTVNSLVTNTVDSVSVKDSSILLAEGNTTDTNNIALYMQHAANKYSGLVKEKSSGYFKLVDLSALPSLTTTFIPAQYATLALNNLLTYGYARYHNSNGYYTELSSATGQTINTKFVFPPVYGTAGQVLMTDGAGNLAWASVNLSQINVEINSLKTQVGDNTSGTSLTDRTTTLESTTTAQTTSINNLNTRVGTAESSISANTASITTNTSNITSLNTRVGTAESSITTNTSNITSLTTRVGTAESNIGVNTSSITSNTSNITSLTTRVGTAESNISTNTTNITSLTTRVGTAESNITTSAGNITALTSRVTTLESSSSNSADLTSLSNRITLSTVKVGATAGVTNPGADSISIGSNAGNSNIGARAIAIGANASTSNGAAGSVCINATSSSINPANAGTYIAPIRQNTTTTNSAYLLMQDTNNEVMINPYVVQNDTLNDSPLSIKKDDSSGSQFRVMGATNTNQRLLIGYDTTNDRGSIQATKQGTGSMPLVVNAAGGSVTIGATADSGYKLRVAGSVGVDSLTSTGAISAGSLSITGSFTASTLSTGSRINIATDIITSTAPINAVDNINEGKYVTALMGTGSTAYKIHVSSDYGSSFTQYGTSVNSYRGIAINDNGKYQLAASYETKLLYLSNDYGVTWGNVGLTNKEYLVCAMSSTGRIMVAAAGVTLPEYIYISTNYGVTWFQTISTLQYWNSIKISASGQYITALGTQPYTSSDFGQTWTTRSTTAPNSWRQLSMSASGAYQLASRSTNNQTDTLMLSTNFGVTWTAISTGAGIPSSSISINSTAIDSVGKYMIMGNYTGNNIYVSSNYGVTWTSKVITAETDRNWVNAAISASGRYQYILDLKSPRLYSSSNYGVTWTLLTYINPWRYIALSRGLGGVIEATNTEGACLVGDTVKADNVVSPAMITELVSFPRSIKIGDSAGLTNQSTMNAMAIGREAGNSGQQYNTVAIGYRAGQTTQRYQGIAIGDNAASTSQNNNGIAIGTNAGSSNQGINAIAIGKNAGPSTQVGGSIILNATGNTLDVPTNVGFHVDPIRNDNTQTTNIATYNTTTKELTYNSTSLQTGSLTTTGAVSAGSLSVSSTTIKLGQNAGQTSQGTQAIAIGNGAGANDQGNNSIMIGALAGTTSSAVNSICLNASGVALNPSASGTYITPVRSNNNATVGASMMVRDASGEILVNPYVTQNGGAGNSNTASQNTAMAITRDSSNVGEQLRITGATNSNMQLLVGYHTVNNYGYIQAVLQGAYLTPLVLNGEGGNVLIGTKSDTGDMLNINGSLRATSMTSTGAVSAGATTVTSLTSSGAVSAASLSVSSTKIALGSNAGSTNQGANAIAIGNGAGTTNQVGGSIILNASGSTLNAATNIGFHVNPIRNDNTQNTNIATYNTTSKELTYNTAFSLSNLVSSLQRTPQLILYAPITEGTTNNQYTAVKIFTNQVSFSHPSLTYTNSSSGTDYRATYNGGTGAITAYNVAYPYQTQFYAPFDGTMVARLKGWRCGGGTGRLGYRISRSSSVIYEKYQEVCINDCGHFSNEFIIPSLQANDVIQFMINENNTINGTSGNSSNNNVNVSGNGANMTGNMVSDATADITTTREQKDGLHVFMIPSTFS